MTITSLNLSNKLPPKTIASLVALNREAVKLGIPFLMVGASAREIILGYGFGIRGTETRDMDFGVATESWHEFERLKTALISTGKFLPDPKYLHRLKSSYFEVIIDLIPFGEIETVDGIISWPNEHRMIVSGFAEAHKYAIQVDFDNDLQIRVASPVGLALLKLISWTDRQANRDADDFWLIASHYLDLGNYERVFGELSYLLERDDYDDIIAGAILLGRDLKKISNTNTSAILSLVLDDIRIEKLAIAIVSERKRFGGELDYIIKILLALREGLEN